MPLCSLSDPCSIIFLKSSSKDALYLVRWSASAMMRAREGLVWMQYLFIVHHCLYQNIIAVPKNSTFIHHGTFHKMVNLNVRIISSCFFFYLAFFYLTFKLCILCYYCSVLTIKILLLKIKLISIINRL